MPGRWHFQNGPITCRFAGRGSGAVAGGRRDGFGVEQFGDRELEFARVLHDAQGQARALRLAVRLGQGCRRPRSDIPPAAPRGGSEQFRVGDMIRRGDDQLVQHPAGNGVTPARENLGVDTRDGLYQFLLRFVAVIDQSADPPQSRRVVQPAPVAQGRCVQPAPQRAPAEGSATPITCTVAVKVKTNTFRT